MVDCLNWRLRNREQALDLCFQGRAITPALLLEIFDWSEERLASANFLGCAFTKTVNEMSEKLPEVRQIAQRAKRMLRDRITALAAECGLCDPEVLGDELTTVLEGAQVLSLIEHNALPFRCARSVATKLLAFHGCTSAA